MKLWLLSHLKSSPDLVNAPSDEIEATLSKEDLRKQQRFNEFALRHTGEKPLLILDVDNTLLFVRFFSDEIRCGDTLTYFVSDDIERNICHCEWCIVCFNFGNR